MTMGCSPLRLTTCRLLASVCVICLIGCGAAGEHVPVADREPPQRLVTMAPSVTELVFALGLGDRVVGVTRYCDHPPEAASRPRMGGYLDPNYEAIVAAEPDLVILIQDHRELRRRLDHLGLATLTVNHQQVAGILDSITEVAARCGVPERGADLRLGIERRLQAVAGRVRGRARPRVLVVVGREAGTGSVSSLWVAGQGSYYHDVLRLAGGENACPSSAINYPEISREGLLAIDPEIIVDVVPAVERGELTAAAARADWQDLRELHAVQRSQVHVLGQGVMEIPGPRIANTVEAVAAILHPVQGGRD